ncbi:general secretion pathway protein G [Amycolatopsis lexingtonensis]|uniref:General secretion pathway protein G n=1 Tax=Amycolatopsis lexingtonensis TaxID=218822 RepID=A0ABR9HU87_9PSEU|nr:prepilin-type N-terminal cleavage/methylation domain-containing protein [Amycolatopsis lexingtonensis]MBE1494493.1 general secretion pathway protein G [Amycolatopsis lexingtonensis]
MLERLRAARANEDGFTLIELLIVVVILGVLAGVVVFAVQAFNGEGQAAACETDWKSVQTADEAFYAKTGSYALVMKDLTDNGYLKNAPAAKSYTIGLAAGGVVTASGACTH